MPWSHCPDFLKIGSSAEIREVGIELNIKKISSDLVVTLYKNFTKFLLSVFL